MAGYYIYTLDGNAFSQLTTNPTDEQVMAIATHLQAFSTPIPSNSFRTNCRKSSRTSRVFLTMVMDACGSNFMKGYSSQSAMLPTVGVAFLSRPILDRVRQRDTSTPICSDPMFLRLRNIFDPFLALLVGILYGVIHSASTSVSELTKDTFEMFSIDARWVAVDIQHRLMFSLLGVVLALSGGYLAKDYWRAKGLSGQFLTSFGNARLWIVFLGALLISCSIFYPALFDT